MVAWFYLLLLILLWKKSSSCRSVLISRIEAFGNKTWLTVGGILLIALWAWLEVWLDGRIDGPFRIFSFFHYETLRPVSSMYAWLMFLVLVLASGRVYFSIVMLFFVFSLIAIGSVAKFNYLGVPLVLSDVFFSLIIF